MDADLDALVKSAFLLQDVKFMNVVSLMILITDYFHTLELEVSLIWTSNWGVVKVLFLLARYSAFFDVPPVLYYSLTPHLSYRRCLIVNSLTSWSTTFGIGVSEVILIVRTYALSGRNRKLLIYLLVQFVAIYITVIVILAVFLRSLKYGAPPLPIVLGCYPTEGSIILFADFVLLLLHEIIVMVITLWIGIRKYRHSQSPLIRTLYRDGVFYFVLLFLISLGNIVVLAAGPPEFIDLLTTFQRVMHSVLSTRILLHVRNSSGRDEGDSMPLSDLRFSPQATGAANTEQSAGTDFSTVEAEVVSIT